MKFQIFFSGTVKGLLGAFEDLQVLVIEFRDSFRGCFQTVPGAFQGTLAVFAGILH